MTYGVRRSFREPEPDRKGVSKVIVYQGTATLIQGRGESQYRIAFVDQLARHLPKGEYLLVPRDKIQEATDRGW